jgi:hypothetical protein
MVVTISFFFLKQTYEICMSSTQADLILASSSEPEELQRSKTSPNQKP